MGLTTEQVRRWWVDPAEFAEEVLWTPTPDDPKPAPMRLEPHQRDFMREASRRGREGHFLYHDIVACWPKREGKSKIIAALGIWRGVTRSRQNIGVLANSERQAQSNLFAYVADFLRDSPLLKGYVPATDFQTRILRIPAMGNKIECYPANYRTIQGTAFQLLLTDELHAAEDRGRAFSYASNQTEGIDSQVLIASQAGANEAANPMWRYYQESLRAREEGRQSHVLFDYRRAPMTPWAVRLAAQARRDLLPAEYERLWENAWGALGQKLFRAADIEAAAATFAPPSTRAEWEALRQALGIGRVLAIGCGLDRAGVSVEGDRTVWTVAVVCERAAAEPGAAPLIIVPACWTLPTGAEGEVLDAERRTRTIYGGADRIVMEYYGCSDVVGKVPGAELQHPTPQAQLKLFNTLHRLLREHRLLYPAAAGINPRDGTPGLLKGELLNMKCEWGQSMLKFGTQSGHDDHVYSLAWAIEAALTGALTPQFVQELGGAQPIHADRRAWQEAVNAAQQQARAEWLMGVGEEE